MLILKVYDYNKICTPYITLKKDNDFVLLGSYDLQLMIMYTKISKILISSNDKNEINKLYYYINLFNECKKDRNNDIMRSLVTDCIGEFIDNRLEMSILREERKK